MFDMTSSQWLIVGGSLAMAAAAMWMKFPKSLPIAEEPDEEAEEDGTIVATDKMYQLSWRLLAARFGKKATLNSIREQLLDIMLPWPDEVRDESEE